MSALLETLNSSDPAVREASADALGALVKYIGEGKIFALMPDLDNLKQDKIKEKAEKIELTGSGAKKAAAKPAAAEPTKSSSGPRVVKPGAAKPGKPESDSAAKPAASSKPDTAAKAKKTVKSGGAAKKAGGGAGKSGGGGGSAGSNESAQTIGLEPDMTLEEAEERVEEIFSTDVLGGLGDSNWKNR